MLVNLTIVSDSPTILTDRKDPLSAISLQAHWARAKRQQHLPKELVLSSITSTLSINQQLIETANQTT